MFHEVHQQKVKYVILSVVFIQLLWNIMVAYQQPKCVQLKKKKRK